MNRTTRSDGETREEDKTFVETGEADRGIGYFS
jgi:hypothetical protein